MNKTHEQLKTEKKAWDHWNKECTLPTLTTEQTMEWLESMLAFNKEVFRCNPKIYDSWRRDKGLSDDPRYEHAIIFGSIII